jgi:hypothetical protein
MYADKSEDEHFNQKVAESRGGDSARMEEQWK